MSDIMNLPVSGLHRVGAQNLAVYMTGFSTFTHDMKIDAIPSTVVSLLRIAET